MVLREKLKAVLEQGLVSSGLPVVSRLNRRRSVLILAYHNIVPTGVAIAGDRSLHLPEEAFVQQLDLLQQTHEVVPLDAALDGKPGDGKRLRVAITFDDAYRGTVTVGVRAVVARAMPATVFVAPAFVGGRFFWWDVVTHAGESGPSDAFRQRALQECRGADDDVRRLAHAIGCETRSLPAAAACASEDEIRTACSHPGITLGSHSWSHPNLACLTASELNRELTQSLAWLRERFQRVLPILSYPYGLSSPAVETAAAAAGYRAGLLITGGWTSQPMRRAFAVPRLNVPAGLSPNGFLLRTAGLLCR